MKKKTVKKRKLVSHGFAVVSKMTGQVCSHDDGVALAVFWDGFAGEKYFNELKGRGLQIAYKPCTITY